MRQVPQRYRWLLDAQLPGFTQRQSKYHGTFAVYNIRRLKQPMNRRPQEVLSVLDKCCESFTFPMLDNGYVYPAATRLSLYRSPEDWAMVIEIFGFSPRTGIPDIHIHTFASRLRREKSVDDYVSRQAYDSYLANNEYNESTFIYPIEEGDWLDPDDSDLMASGQEPVLLRGSPLNVPRHSEYGMYEIALQSPPRVYVFEFCRFLAATARSSVLATADERRKCIPADLKQVMQLEEWNHPDLVNGERPSSNATFRSLAEVLAHGSISAFQPTEHPNTHWKNWPEGGTL